MKRTLLAIVVLLLAVLSLFVGVKELTPLTLFSKDGEAARLLAISRFPRTMSVVVSGMGMAISGAIMQLILSNPFVSPTTGSTADWARLGVLTAILVFPGASPILKMIIASAFAFGGTLAFMALVSALRLRDAAAVPLVGMLFGGVVGALTTAIAYRRDLIQNVTAWMQGSFAMVLRGRYELLYIGLPMLLLALLYANRFTIASLGRQPAMGLGVNYRLTVAVGLAIVSVITSTVLVTVGSVPFVGIVIPNLARIWRGDNLKRSILDIALMGGGFLLAGDILARVILFPFEIPISTIAGITGCLIFLALLPGRKMHAAG